VTFAEACLVFLAGIGAGTINTVVGSGTLITFPTLLAFGIPPVSASMSNAVGLVPGSVSGTWGYRRELKGQWPRLRWQIPASLAGALVGAWLLLHLPADAFEAIVPVLLVIALILVVTQTRIQRWVRLRAVEAGREETDLTTARLWILLFGTFLTGIYGGYFAAAQGVVLVGIMGALVHNSLQELNAAKNLLTLLVNTVSAATYTIVAIDRINWTAAGLIAVGSLMGGFIGAGVGRRLPPMVLRTVIVALGCYAIWRILSLH
jgi:uncharacterized membrane protein YfcA